MAITRFGHLDDFTLKNSKVGIGTSDPTEALEVLGGSRSKDIKVTGIATLTSYEGFQNKKTSYVDNIGINTGTSGTLSGEIVIGAGLTMTVGTGATSGQGSIKSLKVSNTFTPPIGGINDRPSAPKPGALFYNKDFRTIEYWDGIFWRQVDNTTRSGRGVIGGGATPVDNNKSDRIESIQIPTLGTATGFGILTVARRYVTSCASNTRGIFTGGITPSMSDVIDYVTIASAGNATDFGNLEGARAAKAGASSQTRGIFGGGYQPSAKNTMEYVTISTTGNSINFGDMTTAGYYGSGCSSPVRAMFQGNTANDSYAKYSYLTISSLGDAVEWGEPNFKRTAASMASNSVRGINAGGYNSLSPWFDFLVNSIEYITIASNGSAEYFGDLTEIRSNSFNGCSTNTRVVFCGGYTPASLLKTSDYVTIMTQGNAQDFGDLSGKRRAHGQCSDSHGGLGGF